MRVGVADLSGDGWSAGGMYTKVQLKSLLSVVDQDSCDDILAIAPKHRAIKLLSDTSCGKDRFVEPCSPEWPSLINRVLVKLFRTHRVVDDQRMKEWSRWASRNSLDVLLGFDPLDWWQQSDVATCTWVPDFQHIRLPQFFDDWEIEERNLQIQRRMNLSDMTVVSSNDVARDAKRFYPEHAEKVRVYSFPSLFAFEKSLPKVNATVVLEKYGINHNFVLIVNQFWSHKNHMQVLEAMGQLLPSVNCPQVVMIGQTSDYRDPAGRAMSSILARIAELGLEGRAKVLGFVSSEEKNVLLRSCQALLQPSECEGWNTSIEDAKALGRPVIASDISVHREQAPDAYGFFRIGNAGQLAELLKTVSSELPAGPDMQRETESLAQAYDKALESGRALLEICEEAVRFHEKRMK